MLKKQNGQVIIIILLLMAVALTIGLSISSQTSSDINISTKLEESERAFAAAEAGIENTILSGGTSGTSGSFPSNNSSYTVTVDTFTAGHENFVFPKSISQDDTHQLWLVGHDSATSEILESNYYHGSTITLYWGATNTPTTTATGCSASNTVPAIESTLIYKDNSGNFQIKKYAFDPDNSRAGCNHFNAASTGTYSLSGKTYRYKADISSFPADISIPYALRLRFLYNSASEPLAVASQGGNFPSQGKLITSVGSVANTGIARKVEVFEAYQALPGIFDYVLFSGTNLTK